MIVLLPLGFLALTGLLVLLAIYLIKPSYQNKVIPSSYIWRESLKYARKPAPFSTWRNILIILCQVLIILACTLMIVTPMMQMTSGDETEQIVIIDASANMRSEGEDGTRFSRAVGQVLDQGVSAIKRGEKYTVILAGLKAEFVSVQETKEADLKSALDELLVGNTACSYGKGDIEGAVKLSDSLYKENSLAEIYLYTATQYTNAGDINVIDVAREGEWNLSVLNLETTVSENVYNFKTEVAVFGADKNVNVNLEAVGVNDENKVVRESKRVLCNGETVQEVEFNGLGIYEYDTVQITVEAVDGSKDGFDEDNTYIQYGGRKEVIRVQYASALPNNFVNSALLVIQNTYKDLFDIQIVQPSQSSHFEVSGFDLYVFEHVMPSVMPKDGAVLFINPDRMPEGSDLALTDLQYGDFVLDPSTKHPVCNFVDASKITATRYKGIQADDSYDVLFTCGGEKVFVAKNTDTEKRAVLTLNLNYSNFAMLYEFPVMMDNLFNYFIPSTVRQTVAEVNQPLEVNARGSNLKIEGPEDTLTFEQLPQTVYLHRVGTYTVSQKLLSGKTTEIQLFVHIPTGESDIWQEEASIPGLFSMEKKEIVYKDFSLYLGAAILFFLAAEWVLYSREKL